MRTARRSAAAALVAAVAALAYLPASAPANLVAFTEVRGAAGDLDIARIDTASGQRATLPSGLDTAAEELHPSISPDGSRLAFERIDPAAGTRRIVVTDLGTGASADLFNAFDAISLAPDDPSWSASSFVTVGEVAQQQGSGQFLAQVQPVDVSAFPGGPFPRTAAIGMLTTNQTAVASQYERRNITATNQVVQVAGFKPADAVAGGVVENTGGPSTARTIFIGASFDDPTISSSGAVVVMEKSDEKDGALKQAQLVFAPLAFASETALPAIVNAANTSVERPEFSDDGRYLAFVRHTTGGYRLFVWDTGTQLLLDPDGVDLGATPNQAALVRGDGAIALHVFPVILSSSISNFGFIDVHLMLRTDIGIIVQKVVGKTRVLGHVAPKLRFVGRVPLGHFKRGHGHIRWDRKVHGRALAPGTYQVTVRSVTAKGGVRDLGKPVRIRIARRRS